MTKRIHKLDILEYLFCFISVFLILGTLFVVKGYAPFGENSLAWMDGSIQYLDFFSYFKDVLSGTNNIGYSFSKTLGGTNVAVFSYYLSSPFSLLVVFFNKEDMSSFFDVVVLLKLCVASMTMHYFIRHTALYSKDNNKNRFISCLLSICYALSQYTIAQASNIMWLDGVYLLPLIIYGVHKVARGERNTFLSVTVALSILFNWYSGGMNCMFSIFFYIFEMIYVRVVENTKLSFKDYLKRTFNYLFGMFVGVLISCILFLPTISALKNSNRGGINWNILTRHSLLGSVFNAIPGYMIGGIADMGHAKLYCGTITMVGCFALFLDKKVSLKETLYFGFIIISILSFLYLQNFWVLFSLLKDVTSYFIRYSYLCIFTLIWVSSQYFLNHKEHSSYAIISSGIIFGLTMIGLNYRNTEQDVTLVNLTGICMSMMGILVCLYLTNKKKAIHVCSCIALSCLLVFELSKNASILMNQYHSSDALIYHDYSTNETKQINSIKDNDNGTYRISQNATRNMLANRMTSYFNDAYAYNYWSISGYTSSPDDTQREFLDRLGYNMYGENMNITVTTIITADSLVGVKYTLSDLEIKGYELIDSTSINNKVTYENPYVLPMAFTYKQTSNTNDYINSFLYQNALYSQLLGKDVELYTPIEYEYSVLEDGSWNYSLHLLNGNYAYYGNLPYSYDYTGNININNQFDLYYANWLSSSVFYIPANEEDIATVTIQDTGSGIGGIQGEEQFYALNLDLLEEVSKELQSREAETISIENGKADITVEASEGESLYISIPYDKGWTITLNGEEIEPELFGECMYSIPLQEGKNEIKMTYHVPWLNIGIGATCIGVFLLLLKYQ